MFRVGAGLSFDAILGIALGSACLVGAVAAAALICAALRRRRRRKDAKKSKFNFTARSIKQLEDHANGDAKTCRFVEQQYDMAVPVSGNLDHLMLQRALRHSVADKDEDSGSYKSNDMHEPQLESAMSPRAVSNHYMYTRAWRPEVRASIDIGSKLAVANHLHVRDTNSRSCSDDLPLHESLETEQAKQPEVGGEVRSTQNRVMQASPHTEAVSHTSPQKVPQHPKTAQQLPVPDLGPTQHWSLISFRAEPLASMKPSGAEPNQQEMVKNPFLWNDHSLPLPPMIDKSTSFDRRQISYEKERKVTTQSEPTSEGPSEQTSAQSYSWVPSISLMSWDFDASDDGQTGIAQLEPANVPGSSSRRPAGVPKLDIPMNSIMRQTAFLMSSARSISSVDFTFEDDIADGKSPSVSPRYIPELRALQPAMMNRQGSVDLSPRESTRARSTSLSGRKVYSPCESPRGRETHSGSILKPDALQSWIANSLSGKQTDAPNSDTKAIETHRSRSDLPEVEPAFVPGWSRERPTGVPKLNLSSLSSMASVPDLVVSASCASCTALEVPSACDNIGASQLDIPRHGHVLNAGHPPVTGRKVNKAQTARESGWSGSTYVSRPMMFGSGNSASALLGNALQGIHTARTTHSGSLLQKDSRHGRQTKSMSGHALCSQGNSPREVEAHTGSLLQKDSRLAWDANTQCGETVYTIGDSILDTAAHGVPVNKADYLQTLATRSPGSETWISPSSTCGASEIKSNPLSMTESLKEWEPLPSAHFYE